MGKDNVAWLVFSIAVLAYVPLFIGGRLAPSEINVFLWCAWLWLSFLFLWSSKAQGFESWRLPLAFFLGNILILALAFYQGGYTANLTMTEGIIFVGTLTSVGVWLFFGITKKTWSPRIIFWGSIISDIISFYPLIKQYWGPNTPPSIWTITGWAMMLSGVTIQLVYVDRLFEHIKATRHLGRKEWLRRFESKLFSVEQVITIIIAMSVMMW